jgi:hypothetical protein
MGRHAYAAGWDNRIHSMGTKKDHDVENFLFHLLNLSAERQVMNNPYVFIKRTFYVVSNTSSLKIYFIDNIL